MSTNHSNKKLGFKTPNDYFESLEDCLFSRLKEEKIEVKNTGFDIPKDYLDEFESKFFNKIELQKLETGYTTSDNYFENIEDIILNNTTNQKPSPKVISIFSNIPYQKIASIAAIFIISLVGLKMFYKPQLTLEKVDFESIEEYVTTEDLNLDEYELADLYEVSNEELELLSNENIDNNQLYDYLSDEIVPEDYIDSL